MTRTGFLPPIDGGKTALLSPNEGNKILVYIQNEFYELELLEAMALANQIMTTAEVYLRNQNGR